MKLIVNQSRLLRVFGKPTIFTTLGFGSALAIIAATENIPAANTVKQKAPALQTDFPRADLNGDGVVDDVDLGIVNVAVSYGNCTGCPEDLNNDGVVNEGNPCNFHN